MSSNKFCGKNANYMVGFQGAVHLQTGVEEEDEVLGVDTALHSSVH